MIMTAQGAVLFPDCSLGGKAAEMAGRIYFRRITGGCSGAIRPLGYNLAVSPEAFVTFGISTNSKPAPRICSHDEVLA